MTRFYDNDIFFLRLLIYTIDILLGVLLADLNAENSCFTVYIFKNCLS